MGLGSDIARDITNSMLKNIYILYQKKDVTSGRPGFWTTDIIKQHGARTTRLAFEQKRIVFAAQCVSGNSRIADVGVRLPLTKAKFRAHLNNLRMIVTQPLKSTGKPRYVISGKFDSMGNYAGTKDDLGIALILGLYWNEMIEQFTIAAGSNIVDSTKELALRTNQIHPRDPLQHPVPNQRRRAVSSDTTSAFKRIQLPTK